MKTARMQAETIVLMPTCNQHAYLPYAVGSVLAQHYQDWGLLIINDGGADVAPVLKGFRDDRIQYMDIPHSGKAAALNAGIQATRSRFIAYLDDDDFYLPNHLQQLVGALKNHADWDVVCSRTVAEYWSAPPKPGQAPSRKGIEYDSCFETTEMRLQNKIPNLNVVHRRRLFDAIGIYDPHIPFYIDWDLLRKISYVTDFHGIPDVTGVYRRIATKKHLSRTGRAADPKVHETVRAYVASKWPVLTQVTAMEPAKHTAVNTTRIPAQPGIIILPSPDTSLHTCSDWCRKNNIPHLQIIHAGERTLGQAFEHMADTYPSVQRILIARDDIQLTTEALSAHAEAADETIQTGCILDKAAPVKTLHNQLLNAEPIMAGMLLNTDHPPQYILLRNEEALFNTSWPLETALDYSRKNIAIPLNQPLWTAWSAVRYMHRTHRTVAYAPDASVCWSTDDRMASRYDRYLQAGRQLVKHTQEWPEIHKETIARIQERRTALQTLHEMSTRLMTLYGNTEPARRTLEYLAQTTGIASSQLEDMLPAFHFECCEAAFFDTLHECTK